ncbi:aspartate--ammonia ligase [Candidatus Woesearchaeota archaeon]|nr:aspartate--ammonia ligase [Candidatus Woesearchaeota archaeon]
MEGLILPKGYESSLDLRETEKAIKDIKDYFQVALAKALNLERVSAPQFVKSGSGVNDDLNGTERKATFLLGSGISVEALNSLAKWKRMKLKDYGFKEGEGLYTDMNGIRVDDLIDNLHSHYVDQWDWEKVMSKGQRHRGFLEDTVKNIYGTIKETGKMVEERYGIEGDLPENITFVHTEDLQKQYPDLTPRQREDKAAEKYRAIFIIGIGGKLADGKIHDGRAPDYDDWTTAAEDGKKGLNGDIVVWNPLLKRSFELSSMGIRVDPDTMEEQLEIRAKEEEAEGRFDLAQRYRKRRDMEWHKRLLAGEFPQTIGGGIGQSRLCMFYLQKAHIGEVQACEWPDEMKEKCTEAGIRLL